MPFWRCTPAEKFRRMCNITESLNIMTLSLLREQFPNTYDQEYRLRLAARRGVPPDLLRKAFAWDVNKEGY